MSSHLTEAVERQIAGYRAMSPERKLEIAFGLRDFAWQLASTGARLRHPDFSEAQIREEVRRRFTNAGS